MSWTSRDLARDSITSDFVLGVRGAIDFCFGALNKNLESHFHFLVLRKYNFLN